MIAGRFGKLVDAFLRNGDPVADGDFLADVRFEISESLKDGGFHAVFLSCKWW